MNHAELHQAIDAAWSDLAAAGEAEARRAVATVIEQLTSGQLRAATRDAEGTWHANEWVKKAILLHFRFSAMTESNAGPLEFHDKIALQGGWAAKNVRAVPPATVREGAHIAPGAVLMPSYVNIGAFVGSGTMVDTWATIGSCAQIGERCHISGGTGIGGVLEPLQATPTIIEDNCFVGARCEVAEGCIVREGAVLAMGCFLSASTRIYDATTGKTLRVEIPARAVVVPGSVPSADGSHSTYALIVKKYRDEKTDARTALNDLLR